MYQGCGRIVNEIDEKNTVSKVDVDFGDKQPYYMDMRSLLSTQIGLLTMLLNQENLLRRKHK